MKIDIGKWINDSINSKEYQKTLAAFRVYTEFLFQQRRYSNILLTIFSITFIGTIFGVFIKFFINKDLPIEAYFINLFFNISMIAGLLIWIIYEENRFKFIRSLKIILKNKLNSSVITIVFIIFLISFLTSKDTVSSSYFIGLLIAFFIESIVCIIIIGMLSSLNRNSLISFSIDQLKSINNSKTHNKNYYLTKYQLYYYAIYIYYKRVSKDIKEKFKENLENIIGLKYISLLSSQIFYDDPKYRDKLLKILNKLEKIDPLLNNKEFMNIIKNIRKDFNKLYFDIYKKEPEESVFYQKTNWERLKPKIIFLLLIISPTIAIIKILIEIL